MHVHYLRVIERILEFHTNLQTVELFVLILHKCIALHDACC